jgi:hypothetical protein
MIWTGGTPKCLEKNLSQCHILDRLHLTNVRYSSRLLCEMENSSQQVGVISYARYMCHIAAHI